MQTRFATTGGRKRKRGSVGAMDELVIDEAELGGDSDGEGGDGEATGEPGEDQGLVSMRNITKLVKRAHATKADRMDSIAEGREGRKKYGFQVSLCYLNLNYMFRHIHLDTVINQTREVLLSFGWFLNSFVA